MAKLTLTDGTIFEGTTEEIFAITERFNGVKADEPATKTVKRYAEVGERILVVHAEMTQGKYKNGDILTVSKTDAYGVEGSVRVSEHDRHLYSFEYEVIIEAEDTPNDETLEVGDYAKVVVKENSYNGFHEVGAIVGITKVDGDSSRVPYQAVGLDGKESRWFKAKHIVKATDEEVAEATAKARKDSVFTQAGRKPNEYRKGDIVGYDSIKYGQIVVREVTEVDGNFVAYNSNEFGKDGVGKNSERLSLIATVESRLDRN